MPKKFLRQQTVKISRLGKNRKKLQRWRKPKGRDSKMREKRKSYPARPTVGHKTAKKDSGKIDGKNVILVYNLKELAKVDKNSVAIIAKIGAKKKLELIKYASENKVKLLNVKGDKK